MAKLYNGKKSLVILWPILLTGANPAVILKVQMGAAINTIEFDGFLCRGGLPECQWMNVPEALFICNFLSERIL